MAKFLFSLSLWIAMLLTTEAVIFIPTVGGDSSLTPAGRPQLVKVRFRHSDNLYALSLSPDGSTLAGGGSEGPIQLWNRWTGQEIRHFGRFYKCFAFSPDGKTLAAGDSLKICIWEVASGYLIREMEGHPNWDGDRVQPRGIAALAYAPDGKTLASASENGTVRFWDITSGKLIREFLAGDEEGVTAIAYAPDGRMLASAANDDTVRLWEVATGLEIRRFTVRDTGFKSMAFTPDGRTLAAGGRGSPVFLWHLVSGAKPWRLGRPTNIEWLTFRPNGEFLLATCDAKTMNQGNITAVTVALSTHVVPSPTFTHASSVSQQAKQAGKPPPINLEPLWTDLAAADAARAYRAMWAFVQAPQQAVIFLDKHLRPVPRSLPQQVEQLIVDLDSSFFAVRKEAVDKLKRLGDVAEPALRRALADRPSAEVRFRVRQLLEELQNWSPQQLQVLRAIQALEHIGTKASFQTLKRLAEGAPEDRLTQEARASVERLSKHRCFSQNKKER